jgi:broad specificity polyphosphatase/5'/3'-nucleotidase SurE
MKRRKEKINMVLSPIQEIHISINGNPTDCSINLNKAFKAMGARNEIGHDLICTGFEVNHNTGVVTYFAGTFSDPKAYKFIFNE